MTLLACRAVQMNRGGPTPLAWDQVIENAVTAQIFLKYEVGLGHLVSPPRRVEECVAAIATSL
jgi:hypothetical protein